MRSEEEIKTIARDFVMGKIWTNFDFPERDLKLHFMVLGFLSRKDIKAWERRHPVMIFEYASQSRMTSNGRPMFLSCQWMGRREYTKFRKFVAKYEEALRSV